MLSRIRSLVNIPIIFAVILYSAGALTGAFTFPRSVSVDKLVKCGQSTQVRILNNIDLLQRLGATKEDIQRSLKEAMIDNPGEDWTEAKKAVEYAFAKEYKHGAVMQAAVDCING